MIVGNKKKTIKVLLVIDEIDIVICNTNEINFSYVVNEKFT